MPKKTTKTIVPQLSERDNYLRNRNNMVEDFKHCLIEVQQPGLTVSVEICGMNFQQFSAGQVLFFIKEQEEYIEYTKKYQPEYVVLSEEEELLVELVKQAKEVFGDQYQTWYDAAIV
jgi:hypothetical protein